MIIIISFLFLKLASHVSIILMKLDVFNNEPKSYWRTNLHNLSFD